MREPGRNALPNKVMEKIRFPLILSPGPGCPEIISLNKDRSLTVIAAAVDAPCGQWSLKPSPSNRCDSLKPIPLIQNGIVELPQHSDPLLFSGPEDTRLVLSNELLRVLGSEARIFKVSLSMPKSVPLNILREMDGKPRPTMYDISLGPHARPHAVCLTGSDENGVRFIHLTDLHLARRNDLIHSEVSNVFGTIKGFNNFNDNFRKFIGEANELADAGELDLVFVGGDLVDFVNHGVSDDGLEQDNNWQVFVEILTGDGNEPSRGNHGIRVPVFTSTGNHDWRLHPYNISLVAAPFGLERAKADVFDFEYYDNMEKIEAKKNEVYGKMVKEGTFIARDSFHHTVLKWFLRKSETWQAKALVPAIMASLSYLAIHFTFLSKLLNLSISTAVIALLATGIHYIVNLFLSRVLSKIIEDAVIPIEAGVQALHCYLLKINPYMNYAFSFGSNYFIVMDTGPDCLVGQYLWDEGNKKMSRLSIDDNIMGGSPDSMAFYGVNEYYPYGQISWFEKVLASTESGSEPIYKKKRIFVCLHAPPVNIKDKIETGGNDEVLLKEGVNDIRYGTINHYLSQFYHLCLGEKENTPEYSGAKVDIIFSGHAHQKIEFRIASGPMVFTGKYSDLAAYGFDEKRPFVVQTAACGPSNAGFPDPPYYRKIDVDKDGLIRSFKQV